MKSLAMKDLMYPQAHVKKDKERQYARFLDIFKRLQINIPFAEALEQMSTYSKWRTLLQKKKVYGLGDYSFICKL